MNSEQQHRPFPGLKPYSFKDNTFFAGRDRQKLQLLKAIGENNFVAVVGGNGVGKTSLVNSEIVPELLDGFLSNGKTSWKIVSFRPGKKPLSAMATALSYVDIVRKDEQEKVDPNLSDQFEQILRNQNYGIIDIVEQYKLAENDNLLIYIDHLDDLLFNAEKRSESSNRDIKIFIDRLVEVVNQTAYSITVIFTMRTEIIGYFSAFPELAEIINKNQFLLSEYKPNDLMPIFEKITKEGNISFDKSLLRHVQYFYKNNPLILGAFQHAMKRSVEQWYEEGASGPVTLEHLTSVGDLDSSINLQLYNLYSEMSKSDQKTCRLCFQAITGTSSTDTTYSVTRTINEIAEITGQNTEDVIRIVKRFSDDSCGVIVKFDPQDITGRLEYLDYAGQKTDNLITEQSKITIAQDFLLEELPRLNKWIKEEYLNSNIYRDIAKDAERNDPPYEGEKLLATWRWYENVKPHAGWASRYYKNFDLVEEFILKSKSLSDKEIARKEAEELSRQQISKRNRNLKLVFSIVAFALIMFAFFQTRQASLAIDVANDQQLIAEEAEKKAQKAKDEAAFEKRTAELSIIQASRDRELAQSALDSAELASYRAEIAQQEAVSAQRRALTLRNEADQLARTVRTKTKELSKAEQKIDESRVKEEYLGILEAVREYSDEALNIFKRVNNAQQRKEAAQLASRGYKEFLKVNQGKYAQIQDTTKVHTQEKLFSALTQAYQKVGSSKRLSRINYGVALSKNKNVSNENASGEFLIGTNDNNSSIFKVAFKNGNPDQPNQISSADNPQKKIKGIKKISYSNTAAHFIVSHLPIDQTNRYLSKYDIDGNELKSIEMPALIEAIFPYQSENFIVADQNGAFYFIEAASGQFKSSNLYDPKNRLRAIDFHEPSSILYLALSERKIISFKLNGNQVNETESFQLEDFETEISTIKYVDSKNWLIIGTRSGELYLYDSNTKKCIYKSLSEHAGKINCLVVNDDEKYLVSGGRDKIINVWDLNILAQHTTGNPEADQVYKPIEFGEDESIRDVSFLDDNWILVVYSTEGLTTGKGGASLLPLDFDITGEEVQKLAN